MPLRRTATDKIVMTECPACGEDLDDASITTYLHFLREHTPEDFGLTPLGEGRARDTVETGTAAIPDGGEPR